MQVSTPIDDLCSGLPHEFATFLAYARSLRPYELPDHAAARHMFTTLADKLCADDEPVFDWIGVDLDLDEDDTTTDANYPTRTESDEEMAPTSLTRLSS